MASRAEILAAAKAVAGKDWWDALTPLGRIDLGTSMRRALRAAERVRKQAFREGRAKVKGRKLVLRPRRSIERRERGGK